MNKKRKAVDFRELLKQMEEDREEPVEGWPIIVGPRRDNEVDGRWTEAELTRQLRAYQEKQKPCWHIWETTDTCAIGQGWLVQDVHWLERARFFGEWGDLDVRRDGERFLWRYVGKSEHEPKDDNAQNLKWRDTDVSPIYCRERRALLWGTRKGKQEQWFDDRVSGAALTYFSDPLPLPEKVEERVQVKFREYTQAGRTLAVWLLGLEAHQEVKNG